MITKEESIRIRKEEQAKRMEKYNKPELSEKQQYLLEKMGIRLRAKKN